MRVTGIEKVTRAGLAIALAGGLTAYGPSASAETGVTDSTIKIGAWGPLSGPVSLLGESMRDGLRVCVREVNEAGGVNGRKLDLIVYDDAGSPQEAQAAIRRLLNQDQVFMLLGGSASGSTLPVRHVIAREKVPVHRVDLVQHEPDEPVLALHVPHLRERGQLRHNPSPTG